MSEADQSGAGRREVAYRTFAAEFDDADFSYSESDEDRAPNYVITPTGARANRLFVVGVLTEVETVSDDVLRARVVDPTGAFVLYAGQYQPDEQAFLEGASPPTFVAVTGKARTFQPEDGDRIFTSIRPESISEVGADVRDRWTVQAAEQTVERVGWMARALASDARGEDLRRELREQGADDGLAHGISLALDHYGTTATYLDGIREVALDAARVVAGETEEVEPPSLDPDAAGAVTPADLIDATDEVVTDSSPATEPSTATGSPTDDSATGGSDSETTTTGEVTSTPRETTSPPEERTSNRDDETTPEDPAVESSPTEEAAAGGESESDDGETGTTADDESDGAETIESDDSGDEDLGDFDADEFELDPETREEVEEEYGTDFQTGTEVEEPGQADIDTPAEEPAEGSAGATPETAPSESEPTDSESGASTTEPAAADEPDSDATEAADDTEATASSTTEAADDSAPADEAEETVPGEESPAEDEPEDVQATVVDLMSELDDGSGADRKELFAAMESRYGVGREAVEDAIQDALMEGQCYEPDDDSLKPI